MIALLGAAGDARGAEPALPRLATLLGRARLAIAGPVTRLDSYEDGRISVARIRPDTVLKGEPGPGEVAVVEEHDLPSSVPLLETGARVVVFLQRAERTSSLARALPAGPTYWRLVDGATGIVTTTDATAAAETAALVGRIAEATRDTTSDAAARAIRDRALAFDEIAARHPRLVADGAAALPGIPDLARTLDDTERSRLEDALQRADLPEWTRLALITATADAALTQLAPALRALPAPPPTVLAASWHALDRLGQPPSMRDLTAYVTSRDPAIRAVVPAALLAAGADSAIPQVERMALGDKDMSVRRAAIAALGATKRDSVVPSLERVFRAGPTELRPAVGAAYVALASPAAAESVARLVLAGPADGQRGALTILLAVVRRDDPLVVKIRDTHPDPAIRDLIEHGAEMGHHHPG